MFVLQAAAVEVGSSLVNTVSGGKDGKNGADQSKTGPVPEPLKMVGGIGMELLRVRVLFFGGHPRMGGGGG
jgi:hypothetical protein